MDAALWPVRDTATNRAKCPMRLVDLLAAGVPVATQAVGEYGAYVRHEESGLLARPGDEAGLAGADVATISFDVMKQLYNHPLTDIGIDRFLKDWEKVPS